MALPPDQPFRYGGGSRVGVPAHRLPLTSWTNQPSHETWSTSAPLRSSRYRPVNDHGPRHWTSNSLRLFPPTPPAPDSAPQNGGWSSPDPSHSLPWRAGLQRGAAVSDRAWCTRPGPAPPQIETARPPQLPHAPAEGGPNDSHASSPSTSPPVRTAAVS